MKKLLAVLVVVLIVTSGASAMPQKSEVLRAKIIPVAPTFENILTNPTFDGMSPWQAEDGWYHRPEEDIMVWEGEQPSILYVSLSGLSQYTHARVIAQVYKVDGTPWLQAYLTDGLIIPTSLEEDPVDHRIAWLVNDATPQGEWVYPAIDIYLGELQDSGQFSLRAFADDPHSQVYVDAVYLYFWNEVSGQVTIRNFWTNEELDAGGSPYYTEVYRDGEWKDPLVVTVEADGYVDTLASFDPIATDPYKIVMMFEEEGVSTTDLTPRVYLPIVMNRSVDEAARQIAIETLQSCIDGAMCGFYGAAEVETSDYLPAPEIFPTGPTKEWLSSLKNWSIITGGMLYYQPNMLSPTGIFVPRPYIAHTTEIVFAEGKQWNATNMPIGAPISINILYASVHPAPLWHNSSGNDQLKHLTQEEAATLMQDVVDNIYTGMVTLVGEAKVRWNTPLTPEEYDAHVLRMTLRTGMEVLFLTILNTGGTAVPAGIFIMPQNNWGQPYQPRVEG